MKKITLLFSLMALLAGAAVAQTTVTDSIKTGDGTIAYANDVYYSLKNGEAKVIANNGWQLAFSIGVFNVGVRANTATSATGDGSVTIYEMPGTDTSKWSNFDTVGASAWEELNNSDQDWEAGALNSNISGAGDYGWGMYDPSSHIVTGHRLYLVKIRSGVSTVYKKVFILDKTLGVWHIRYADLNGSNVKNVEIKSSEYEGKNFAYLSLLTDEVKDREPISEDWDLVLTRYKIDLGVQGFYPATGILTNAGVITAEVKGKEETTATLTDTTSTSTNISEIGSDWKQLNAQFQYVMVDSLCYFVRATDGAFWKLVFTEFASNRGHVAFNKTKLTLATGVTQVGNSIKNFVAYPNPASGSVSVLFDVEETNTTILLTDLMGRTMMEKAVTGSGFQNQLLDLNNLSNGVYLLNIMNGNSRSVQKIVKN